MAAAHYRSVGTVMGDRLQAGTATFTLDLQFKGRGAGSIPACPLSRSMGQLSLASLFGR